MRKREEKMIENIANIYKNFISGLNNSFIHNLKICTFKNIALNTPYKYRVKNIY